MDADAPGQTAPTDPDALRHEQADQLLRDYLREAEPIRGVLPVTMFAGGRFRPAAAVDLASGRAVLEAEPPLQIAFLLAALDWSLDQIERHRWTWEFDQLAALTAQLLRRRQPYTAADVEWILERLAGTSATWHDIHGRFGYSLRSPLRSVARWCDDQPLPRESVNALARLRSRLAEAEAHADGRDLLELIDQVLGEDTAARDLIDPRDDWGHHAAAALSAMEPASRRAWLEFLRHAAACAGSKPSKKWLVQASGQIVALGNDPFRELVTAWFGFLNEPSRNTTYRRPDGFDFPSSVIADRNADLLKGLAWCCAAVDDDALALTVGDATLACFKKIPGIGARSPRAGNAGAVALSLMPGLGGVAQLQRLSGRVKLPSVQKQIEAALERAAVHSGLAREDLEELAVPDFGLRDGRACVSLGDVAAEISLSGPDTVRLRWRSGLGREQATVPAEVKRDFPTELAALRQTIKAIQTALPAQRQRLERLLLAERRWTLNAWRARYLDHGQLAHLTRRLIWTFEQGAHAEQGMWLDGRVVDVLDRPLDRLDSETSVRPWHPIESSPEVILGWREWLERHQVAQPFKQAHREVYLLTDTERSAGTRSIRFGGHVLRQHQFHALCRERGWQYRLQGNWDSANTPTLDLPRWGLRAALSVDGGHDDPTAPASGHGIYLYGTTGAVSFRSINGRAALLLADVPALAFSEVMRDVDLFVAVCGIGSDPTWIDGEPAMVRRHLDYWWGFSQGDLSTTAQTRRAVLERILPRLPGLAERCTLSDRFLLVRGDRRSYRIHLGSGNVFLEPDNRHLCLVPGRGADNLGPGRVFLPFEDDVTLSLILSKAFLLADDHRITDPTILRQLGVEATG